MRALACLAAVILVMLASCKGTEVALRPSASPSTGTVSPRPSSSGEPLGRITDCKGLHVPRVELNTSLNREAGLLMVNYTINAKNRSFTIAYDDPSCRQNPEVKKLLRNVGV